MEYVESPETQRGCREPQVSIVAVAVYTTSGAFPGHGHKREKATEIIANFLSQAARALRLTDTSGWVATVDDREIDSTKSYAENNLSGTVTIHWGPREGGGGC